MAELPIILCVRNDPSDTLGIAPRLLREAGCDVEVLDAFEETPRWPEVTPLRSETPLPSGEGQGRGESPIRTTKGDLDGLIVFGGEMNADQLDHFPYLLQVRQLMRDAVGRGVPTLGICLGAQILARAFGASVYRAPVRELGFTPIDPSPWAGNDPMLGWLQPGDRFFQWHEDTFDLPAGATLLATGHVVRAQAFRLGSGWGIQFHPEVDAEEIDQWLREAAGSLEAIWGRSAGQVMAEAQAHLPDQSRRAGSLFQAFAGQVTLAATTS